MTADIDIRAVVEELHAIRLDALPAARDEVRALESRERELLGLAESMAPSGDPLVVMIRDRNDSPVPYRVGHITGRKPPGRVNLTALRDLWAGIGFSPAREALAVRDEPQPPNLAGPSIATVRKWREHIPPDMYEAIVTDTQAPTVFEVDFINVDPATGELAA